MSPAPTLESPTGASRLLLVSNRLPITIRRSEGGKYDFSMSSGGLVTGLSGLSKTTTFQWYGWPGMEVPEDEVKTVKDRLKEYNATPVFINDKLADRHYNGFSSTSHHLPCLSLSLALLSTLGFPLVVNKIPQKLTEIPCRRFYPVAAVALPPRRDRLR